MDVSDMDTNLEELIKRLKSLMTPLCLKNNEVHLLNKLQGLVKNIKWSSTKTTDLFDALLKRFERTSNDRSHLLSWLMEMLHCIEIHFITPSWRCETGKTLVDLVQDETVTDDELKKCLENNKEKQLDEILEEICQQKLNQVDRMLLNDVRDTVSSVYEDLKMNKDGSQRSGLKKDLLRICQAAEKTHFRPRLTQMVSWCIMALSTTGQLIQVGTGEGKSCIVAMFAAFRAMRGDMVEIFTSSPVLAERDLKEWKQFYDILNISVDCNTNKQDHAILKECYKCQVVYGTPDRFAGDWLRQHFEKIDIFGNRKFQCAIVDEVDSLMLDKGLGVVYLSSDTPALQHLNPLLAFIWATANQYSKINSETTVGRKHTFPHVMLENIAKGKEIDQFTILQMAENAGLLVKGSVQVLHNNPSLLSEKTANVTAKQLAEFFKMVERRFPSCQFDLHCMNNDGAIEKLNKGSQKETSERQRVPLLLLNGGFCQYMYSDKESMSKAAEVEIKQALHFTPCQLSQDKCSIYVPGFLSDLVQSKLKLWIENAFYALALTVDHRYVIEKHGVVPVDYSCTGVIENHMKWTDGLHQFLEMKHKSKLSDMTAITNYMSNVCLLQKYGDQIFGISGTLGQRAEMETLQKIYNGIKTCQIPSFKRRKLVEIEGLIVNNEKDWIEKTCQIVTVQTNPTPYRAQRPVLVICETINRAKILHHALQGKVQKKNLYISNNMDNSAIFAKDLEPGEVIIATNLAGRGTDLRVSEQVKAAGGLFVVQTFLPKNARVEAQAFGRTARQGSPGSAQLIVCSSHLPEPLKLQASWGRLQSVLENAVNVTQVDQDCFVKQFRLYQKSHRDEISQFLLWTLLRILLNTTDSGIKNAKEVRDVTAAKSLTSFAEIDVPNIKKKGEFFDEYLKCQNDLYTSSSNKPADADLSALNEFWGMWLLTNLSQKDFKVDLSLQSKLEKDLETARQKLRERESPLSNLHHYTAFGNELRKKGHLAESIKMYTKAIQKDQCWAAIAYYNRAFASLSKERHQDRKCIDQALKDLQNALKSIEFYHTQIKVTETYATLETKQPGCNPTRFIHHMSVRCEMLKSLKGNITEAIKTLQMARDTGRNVKVNEKLMMSLIPSNLITLAMLIQLLSVQQARDPLSILQLINDPSFDMFSEQKRLESLGLTHVYTLDTSFSLHGFFSKTFGW